MPCHAHNRCWLMGSTHVSTLQANAAQAGLLVQYEDVSCAIEGIAGADDTTVHISRLAVALYP